MSAEQLSNAPILLLSAVEPSADALGSTLIRELRKIIPDVKVIGCGGPLMAKEGFETAFSIDAFSVMGVADALKIWPEGKKRTKELAKLCVSDKVDAAILIDAWLFSKIAAKEIKKLSPTTKLIKYATPQVWASRPKRVHLVKELFDEVLNLLPFEPPYFEKVGIKSTFTGNPNFENITVSKDETLKFKEKYQLQDQPILCLLPGSRKSEVQGLADIFLETVCLILKDVPTTQFILPTAPAVRPLLEEIVGTWSCEVKLVDAKERFAAFKISDAALAASGTVSTELAICGAPHVVAYKVDAVTSFWAKRSMIIDFISILNITANREVIPEFIQDDCEAEFLAPKLIEFLTHQKSRAEQLAAFDILLKELGLGGKPAAQRAAEAIAQAVS